MMLLIWHIVKVVHGNIFENNYEILVSLLSGVKINPGFSYSEETLNSLINEIETNFEDRLIEPSFYIEENNLILSKGKNGIVINREKLQSEIMYLLNNLDCNNTIINIPVEEKVASTLDINKIHEEINNKK